MSRAFIAAVLMLLGVAIVVVTLVVQTGTPTAHSYRVAYWTSDGDDPRDSSDCGGDVTALYVDRRTGDPATCVRYDRDGADPYDVEFTPAEVSEVAAVARTLATDRSPGIGSEDEQRIDDLVRSIAARHGVDVDDPAPLRSFHVRLVVGAIVFVTGVLFTCVEFPDAIGSVGGPAEQVGGRAPPRGVPAPPGAVAGHAAAPHQGRRPSESIRTSAP